MAPTFSHIYRYLLTGSLMRSGLTDQHLRAVEERDGYRVANKQYADELRALRAEHFACVRQLACVTAENLQLRAEIDSLRPPASD
jgi:hypothetical protein